MPDPKFGTIEDLIDLTPVPLRPVTRALHDLLTGIDPDACIVTRLGDRATTFGVGPKKMSEGYCYILPYAKWVNLGFYKGADLPDPEGLLSGTGAKLRHIRITSVDQCHATGIATLIRAALQERRRALGHG